MEHSSGEQPTNQPTSKQPTKRQYQGRKGSRLTAHGLRLRKDHGLKRRNNPPPQGSAATTHASKRNLRSTAPKAFGILGLWQEGDVPRAVR